MSIPKIFLWILIKDYMLFLLGSAVFTPFWGTLFDIYGRKKMMLYVSFFGIIITFIMAFSPDPITMLAMSLIIGIW